MTELWWWFEVWLWLCSGKCKSGRGRWISGRWKEGRLKDERRERLLSSGTGTKNQTRKNKRSWVWWKIEKEHVLLTFDLWKWNWIKLAYWMSTFSMMTIFMIFKFNQDVWINRMKLIPRYFITHIQNTPNKTNLSNCTHSHLIPSVPTIQKWLNWPVVPCDQALQLKRIE